MIYKILKRTFDILFSFLGFIILIPLFTIISIGIKITSKGPIFFRQVRVGQNFKEFNIYKFRTMIIDAEKNGPQISINNDKRITWIGSLLRKYKLDELSQIINVFLGDMSLVGPRPEVPRYVKMFKKDYQTILRVKPGITDIVSIEYISENELLSGENNPEIKYLKEIMPAKLKLSKKYIDNKSILFDFTIIIKTIISIFNK